MGRTSPKASPTKERVAWTERDAKALELRKAGATFEEIASALGLANRGSAYRVVKDALAAVVQEPADALRKVERERLDKMQKALWPGVLRGEPLACKVALGVMERRARMLGLDAPLKRTVEVITHDAFSAAMQGIEAEIAALERGEADASNRAAQDASITLDASIRAGVDASIPEGT